MDTCVCVVEIYRLSLSFPRSLAHVDVLVHVRGRAGGYDATQGCGVWVTWDTYSKKLFRHVVHLGHPPAPAVRRTREPSLRAPGGPERRRRNGRLTHTTGHRSAATLVVSSASAPTCDYHTPHSPLPVWSPCSISRRLWPAGPRASWLHRQRFGQRSVNAQRGPHTSHDNPHRPPVPRPPRRAFAPATAAPPPTHSGRRFSRVRAGRAASAPSEVRIAYWAMGVEPLRPERCTTMSVRRYSVYSASRASRVHAPYVRVSRAPAPPRVVVWG